MFQTYRGRPWFPRADRTVVVRVASIAKGHADAAVLADSAAAVPEARAVTARRV